jgi:hypothetical protein
VTPAELVAAANRLDAIPDRDLERCLGADGQPCGATPALSRDAVRALAAHLRIAAQHYVQVPASLLDLARAILAKEGT